MITLFWENWHQARFNHVLFPKCTNHKGITIRPRMAILLKWQDIDMMTSSNGNIFRVTGPLCGEFTDHRWIPCTKASGSELWCFFDLRPNKRLSKQSWGWWFDTPSRSLWRYCNGVIVIVIPYKIWGLSIEDFLSYSLRFLFASRFLLPTFPQNSVISTKTNELKIQVAVSIYQQQ